MIVVTRFARAVLLLAAVASGSAAAQQAPPLPILPAPTIDTLAPTVGRGMKYSHPELGIRLSVDVEWEIKGYPPGGDSDGRIKKECIFCAKRRTSDAFDVPSLPVIWATAFKLEKDDLRTAAEYLSANLQRGRNDPLLKEKLPEIGEVETVTLAGKTYARAKFQVNPKDVGKAESVAYVLFRRGHAVHYTLMYADEKDRIAMEKIVAAIKYQD